MSDRIAPESFDPASYWYYTHIESGSPSVVTVRRAAADQEVCEDAPGICVLRLLPQRGTTHIVDVDGLDRGHIRPEGILSALTCTPECLCVSARPPKEPAVP
jgi:hypothetical protein